jgi:hypothetical protein
MFLSKIVVHREICNCNEDNLLKNDINNAYARKRFKY